MIAIASTLKTSLSKKLATGLVVAAMGLMLAGGHVHAQDNEQEPGSMPCQPLGTDLPPTIPENTVIKVGGSYYQCIRGQWWKVPGPIVTQFGASQVDSTTATKTLHTGLSRSANLRAAQ